MSSKNLKFSNRLYCLIPRRSLIPRPLLLPRRRRGGKIISLPSFQGSALERSALRLRLAFVMVLLTQEAGASAALRPQAEPGDEMRCNRPNAWPERLPLLPLGLPSRSLDYPLGRLLRREIGLDTSVLLYPT